MKLTSVLLHYRIQLKTPKEAAVKVTGHPKIHFGKIDENMPLTNGLWVTRDLFDRGGGVEVSLHGNREAVGQLCSGSSEDSFDINWYSFELIESTVYEGATDSNISTSTLRKSFSIVTPPSWIPDRLSDA